MPAQITHTRDAAEQSELEGQQDHQLRAAAHAVNVAQGRLHIIIPVLDEAAALHAILPNVMAVCGHTIIVDNGSTDGSAEIARAHRAAVVYEPRRGYGSACLAGIAALPAPGSDDIIVFMDGDASDDLGDLPALIAPIRNDEADLVIGSRTLGHLEPGALTPHARLGNWIATTLIFRRTGVRFTDLGPFRAIRYDKLCALDMQDRAYGWTVEMQLKAARHRLRVTEVPVRYRKRIGRSKISGTITGSVRAGCTILRTIVKYGG